MEVFFFPACHDAACFDPSYTLPPMPDASGQADRLYFPRSLSVTGKKDSPVHSQKNNVSHIHLMSASRYVSSVFWEVRRIVGNLTLCHSTVVVFNTL